MSQPGVHAAAGARRGRVALLTGCAQSVLDPGINEAAIRLLTRLGVEVVVPQGEACCGALVHHMGREAAALAAARRNIDAWTREIDGGGLDAIIITASGCGTTIKDYGFMLRLDPAYAEKAARVSALAKDVTEFLATLDLPEPAQKPGLTVAYHSACSMQHGQKITRQPKELLRQGRLRRAGSRAKAISAAARPAPTTSCSRRSPRSCATARPRTSPRPAPTSSPPAISAASTQIAGARRHADRAHGRAARLGLWRAEAAGALQMSCHPNKKGQRGHCGALPSLAAVRSDPSVAPAAPANYMTITLVPTLTRSNRSTTSSLRSRMQPDETLVPIVHGALVPWMR